MKQLPRSILEKINFNNDKSFNRKIKELCKQFYCSRQDVLDNLKAYGIYDYEAQHIKVSRAVNQPGISIENEKFEKLLYEKHIKYSVEFPLNGYYYDFKVNDILIEVDPSWTHNSTYDTTIARRRVNKLNPNYHHEKSVNALNSGYKIIHIFDWTDIDKILDIIQQESAQFKYEFVGIKAHKITLESSNTYKSFVISDDNRILPKADVLVYDDGFDLSIL